ELTRMQNFVPIGTFDYSQSQILFSAGAKATDKVSVGATIKAVNQEIDTESDWSTGVDAGVILIPHRYVRLGFAARDAVSAKLKLSSTEEETPSTIAGGVAFVNFPLSKRTDFSAAVEVEKSEDRSEKVHAGGELVLDNACAIRGGYDRDNVSFGVGYAYRVFSFDYAYKVMDRIDNSHRISLSLKLGEPAEPAIEPEQELTPGKPPTSGAVPYEFTRQFEFYKGKADDYFDQNKLDSALMYYKRALDFAPDNTEIKTRIGMIQHALFEARPVPPPPMTEQKPQIITNGQTAKIVGLYLEQSRSFYNEGYFAPALELLEQILLMDPQHKEAKQLSIKIGHEIDAKVEGSMNEAQAAEKSGEFARAVEAYTKVLELNPGHLSARQGRDRLFQKLSIPEKLYLGIKHYEQGQMVQAKSAFEAVLAIDSTNEIARSYLDRIGKPTVEAKPVTLEQLQADSNVWPHYLDGLKFMREKNYQKAIEAWEKVLAVYPNSIDTKNNINQAKLRLEAEKDK
ncbi:MAG TPA: tetratricopeptide repeat protein, partial [candidate division Zixibacteria bacterium]|nr:tetratricopeptide repeat protein [candidate division Zixibacteria bacterium]